MTQLVMPSDSNQLGTAFGGKIMQWVDMAAGVAARRHVGSVAVTASIDGLQFRHPVHLGDVLVLQASVNRTWTTSMEVGVRVECEPFEQGERFVAARAYLTFVAVDKQGRPRDVPPLAPQTDEDRRRHAAAQQRRDLRLKSAKTVQGAPADANATINRVIGRLAHDLNNPLSVVVSNLRYLESSITDPELKEAAEESSVAADRLTHMIDASATLAALGGGRFQPQMTEVSIEDIRQRIDKSTLCRLGSRKLKWHIGAETLHTDARLFQRILQALVDHGVGRCPAGGTIRVEIGRKRDGVLVRVHDSGPPFAPQSTPSFLSDSIPLPRPTDGKYRSDEGLGLYFAGRVARALGAQVTLHTDGEPDGQGVVFEILFAGSDQSS